MQYAQRSGAVGGGGGTGVKYNRERERERERCSAVFDLL
jgi:hypothetical protein